MVTIENDENRRRITYIQNNVGIIFEYENNELISKTEIMESNGKILKNGKEEVYKNGIPVRVTGYKDGVPHGREVELDLNTRQISTKLYENGKDVTSKFSVKDSIKNIGEASVHTVFEEDPKRALQRLMNELINMIGDSKDHKIPNIKIDFKDPELKEGEVVNNYITFYEDGSPKVISEQAFLQDGNLKFRGTYYEHSDDGKLMVSGKYNENGEKDGVFTFYKKSGEKEEKTFKNGKEVKVNDKEEKKEPQKRKRNIEIPLKSKILQKELGEEREFTR